MRVRRRSVWRRSVPAGAAELLDPANDCGDIIAGAYGGVLIRRHARRGFLWGIVVRSGRNLGIAFDPHIIEIFISAVEQKRRLRPIVRPAWRCVRGVRVSIGGTGLRGVGHIFVTNGRRRKTAIEDAQLVQQRQRLVGQVFARSQVAANHKRQIGDQAGPLLAGQVRPGQCRCGDFGCRVSRQMPRQRDAAQPPAAFLQDMRTFGRRNDDAKPFHPIPGGTKQPVIPGRLATAEKVEQLPVLRTRRTPAIHAMTQYSGKAVIDKHWRSEEMSPRSLWWDTSDICMYEIVSNGEAPSRCPLQSGTNADKVIILVVAVTSALARYRTLDLQRKRGAGTHGSIG